MVDVGDKPVTARRAVASAWVSLRPETVAALRDGEIPKGDALAVARIAGIQGAKATSTLIPLCHPLPLDQVTVDITLGSDGAGILTEARTQGRTGVEMEALTAAATAGLALIDMVKAVDRGAHIAWVRLERKEGGKSGLWIRQDDDAFAGSRTDGDTGTDGDTVAGGGGGADRDAGA